MLEIIGLNKAFDLGDSDFEVLKDINLSAETGEFISIVGPSGCGKSILLYLIAGFLKKTSGEILVEGISVDKPNTDTMMLFQDFVLFPWKTVYGNVMFGIEKANISKQEKDELVMRYLDLVGLSSFKDWYIYKLSGGMQQRVAIARALVVNPKILLMDEPFSALDSEYRKFLRKSLLEIWQRTKKTIIFVTHSIGEAIYLSDKVYVFTTRPAMNKKVYSIDVPRPRDFINPEVIRLKKEIESEMSEEFEKTINEQEGIKPLKDLLKIKL